MSTLNQTYKELAIPFFKESFDCIDEVMQDLNIPYYLIGVNAIALELLKKGIKPSRGTKDIDFAVMRDGKDSVNASRQTMLLDAIKQVYAKPQMHKETDPKSFYKNSSKELLEVLKDLAKK